MTITREQLTRIIESADEVITALAGTNDDIHPDNSTKMCAAWDDLNDRNAPPSVVKRLAEMALAVMEAEPVAWRYRHHNGLAPSIWKYVDSAEECKSAANYQCQALYAAPKSLTTSERAELENYRNAQQVAPEWTNQQCLEFLSIAFRHAEIKGDLEMDDIRLGVRMVNACRAAMLQAGNSPVIPDDVRRMDWLVSKTVDVREPLVYGSHSLFWSQTLTDEEDDHHATKLREQIDAAMAAEKAAAPQQEAE